MASGDSPPPPVANGLRKKRKMMNYGEGNQASTPLKGEESVSVSVSVSEEDEDDDESYAKPIGNVVRVSGTGESTRNHFNGFQADGICYQLEDTVLVIPEEYNMNMKPSVAIIKDIAAMKDGKITVAGQRFYRPEVVHKVKGGNSVSSKGRELFYSFEKREFPADSIMHKCQVHFIPPNKKIPNSKEHPGFIVRKVYDANSKIFSELLDTGYEESRQHEINSLVQKTITRIPN